jgi:outer membrane lipoprotein-sorting protein
VIKKHIAVTGGEAAWNKISDMTMDMTTEMQGMSINIKTIRKAPNKMMLDVNMMGNSLQKIVFDGTKGYMSAQGQKKEFDAKESKEYADEASMSKDLGYLNPTNKLNLVGIEKVDGKDAYLVEVTNMNGDKVNEYYDVASGLKVKTTSTSEGQTQTVYYSEYKDGPGGLKYPNMIKQSMGPQLMEMKLKSVEVNTGVSDEVFK